MRKATPSFTMHLSCVLLQWLGFTCPRLIATHVLTLYSRHFDQRWHLTHVLPFYYARYPPLYSKLHHCAKLPVGKCVLLADKCGGMQFMTTSGNVLALFASQRYVRVC